jgi:CDP-glycerol glycerophosphotransferase (TagB/SpsB family)
LNAIGEELIEQLGRAGFCVIVKLHDNSRDADPRNSGGINWVERLTPIIRKHEGHLAARGTIAPYLVAADVMISDHSSAGFEYLLLDRPLIRIEMPELMARTNIHPDYVDLLVKASTTVRNTAETVQTVESAYADPAQLSMQRKAVADDLFYKPGTATTRALTELYKVIELSPSN